MATKEELATKFSIKTEEKPRYESEVVEPRRVEKVVKHADQNGEWTGAFDLIWVDVDGVRGRHTTTQYNPPTVKPKDIVVGGWLDDGYELFTLPASAFGK